MPNKLTQFWQELKRRNVVRVITVYAGAAFVIIELINNITEPLRLPEWIPTFVIVLLAIGFPFVIIFSWIYDVHPEGRIVKTEPASKVISEGTTKDSKGWKIASYVSFVIILTLLFFQFLDFREKNAAGADMRKAIAVLPFDNLSGDPEQEYFSDGITDDILNHLVKIADLSVKSRASTLQYKDRKIPIPQIGDELGVDVILEGSVRREGDQVRIVAQLIDVKTDSHLWSETFDRKLTSIFITQSEIAIEIAHLLQATLTEEEKNNINKEASDNITAYDYYLQARQLANEWEGDEQDLETIIRLYKQAIDLDPDFALGYYGIGWALYYGKRRGSPPEIWIDSALALAGKAIGLDPSLPEGYILRSAIYGETLGNKSASDRDLLKAYELAPNNPDVLYSLSNYYYEKGDYEPGALMRVRSVELRYSRKDPEYFTFWGLVYEFIGEFEKAEVLFKQTIKLDPGQRVGNDYLANLYVYSMGKYKEAIEIYEEMYKGNENGQGINDRLGWANLLAGNLDSAEMHWSKYKAIERNYTDTSQYVPYRHRLAYVKWLKGEKEEAMSLFREQMELDMETMKGLRGFGAWNNKSYFYDLGAVHAFLGNKEEAYMMLDSAAKYGLFGMVVITIDPLLDGIREEERFQMIFNKENELLDLRREAYNRIIQDYESRGHLQWFFEEE
jgi:TolB-like protein/Tfp pilus assembly protein PilF